MQPSGWPIVVVHRVRRPALGLLRNGRRGRLLAVVSSIAVLVLSSMVGLTASLAVFTDTGAPGAVLGTKAIFPGQRVTPAFTVGDASGGGAVVDRSSPLGYAADGRTVTSSAWLTGFSGARYLDFDMNASLPGGLAVSAASFEFRFASAGGGSACAYFEVRRIILDRRRSGHLQWWPPRLRHGRRPDVEHDLDRLDRHLD